MEKETLGLYVSGHPLDEYMSYIKNTATITSKELIESTEISENGENLKDTINYDGQNAVFCGVLTSSKLLTTKSAKQMMFANIEDMYGSIELVIFPNVYAKYYDILQADNVLKVTGKISIKEDEKPKIIVSTLETITANKKIYIRLPKDKFDMENRVIDYIKNMGNATRGSVPVFIFYDGTNKIKALNRTLWLNVSKETLDVLKTAFGEENVKVK